MFKMQLIGTVFWLCLVALSPLALADEAGDEELLKWEAPEYYKKNFPYYLSGVDEDGSEIWLVEQGKWDIRAVVDTGGQALEDYRKWVTQMFVRFAYKNRNSDKNKQSVIILNMEGLTFEKVFHPRSTIESMKLLRVFVDLARKGGFKKGFIVNANAVFETVSSLGKPLFGELSDLIEIYGTKTESWIPKLLKQLPRDQLPEAFGGVKDHKFKEVYG